MHDLEAFSREIVSLIKTSGDTGDSGDKLKKPLPDNDYFVPTRRHEVSPLNSDWGQGVAASGDRKSEHLQLVAANVPTVPTATTQFRGGRALVDAADFPVEWRAILAELKQRDPVDWLSAERWAGLLFDAENFLSSWGSVAHSLGWTALDLFGVHPIAPAARFDVMGLMLLTQGGAVVALTADRATVRRTTGGALSYRRPTQAGAVLISKVQP